MPLDEPNDTDALEPTPNEPTEPTSTEPVEPSEAEPNEPEPNEPEEPSSSAPPPGVQRRIDQAIARQRQAEREAQYWQNLALANQQPQQQQVPEPPKEPRLEDFGYDEDRFNRARADYDRERAVHEARTAAAEEAKKAREEAQREAQAHSRKQQLGSFTAAGQRAHEDWDAAMTNPELDPFHPAIAEALLETGDTDLAYALAKDPATANRLAQLDERNALIELGRFASRQKPAKRTTGAPPPVKTVGNRNRVNLDPSKMSMDEYVAARNAGKL